MNILHTETLKKWGGQQNRVLQEAIGLELKGHKVIIACHHKSMLSERAKEAGIRTYEVTMRKKAYPFIISSLISIIRKEEIEIVCTHSSIDSWAGGIAALLTHRKLVRVKHNMYYVKKDPLTRFIYSLPRRFITVSDTAASVLLNTGYIKAEKVIRVYGAIDLRKFDAKRVSTEEKKDLKSSLGIPDNSLVIGNTSGFTGVKGKKYLLTAADEILSKMDNVFFLLPGRRGRSEKLLNLVSPEFRSRVILPGHRTDISQLLSIMDIFVMPSTVEGFGQSLIEAMAMSRPVAVSDIPSFREYIEDGHNGMFFRSADSKSILDTLVPLINNPRKRLSIGENARKTVLEKFLFERMIDDTEGILINVLNKKR